jgi:cystathionine beta-lyase
MHLSEILIHLGEDRERYFNAVAPPIIQTSNFAFPDLASFRKAMSDEMGSHLYTRGNNPTVEILRKKLAALEGSEDALVVSSGVTAVALPVLANVNAGDHIICIQSAYSWTNTLLTKLLPRFDVSHTYVDGKNLAEIEAAIQPNTRLMILESPNSLVLELQDLEACAKLAKQHNITTFIDNSYASPLYQKPIELGIDIVMHTGTKYLNGHSDVVFGVICGTKAMIRKIFQLEFMTIGAILGPHEAAMVLRGLRTLEIRLQRCNESAHKIVAYLEQHPKIERVVYPLSPSHPQYELAKKQMTGAGGLFAVYLKADSLEKAEAFFHRLKRFLLAVSWGGYESLVMPSVAFYNVPGKEDSTHPWNLVRFYIGLEDPDWLIEDLEHALVVL